MKNKSFKKNTLVRFFEIMPGLVAWSLISLPVWGGLLFPELVAYFVLAFNSFWLTRSLTMALYFVIGYFKIRNAEYQDWMSKLYRLDDIDKALSYIRRDTEGIRKEKFKKSEYKERVFSKIPVFLKKINFFVEKRKALIFLKREKKELKQLKKSKIMEWHNVRHIVIIPFWKESYDVIKRSIDKLSKQTFPTEKISIVLGTEARYPPSYETAKRIKKEFKSKFENIWINTHKLKEDEVVGKSSNMASAGRLAQRKIEDLKLNKKNLTITSCDCDTQFDKQYFAYLTYLFVKDSQRYKHFYAAPMLYYANIWRVPFYIRIANTFFSVSNIATSATDRFIQISTYSFSWQLLEDINFWSVDVIPEDFHMFFKALFKYGNQVKAVPIFLKNISNAAESIGHKKTIKNQYEQVKRWAWGVSDHGWMIRNLIEVKEKSLYMFYRVFHVMFDHITWSFIAFILAFGANIPPLINKGFSSKVLGLRLPKVSSLMLTISTFAFVLVIVLDYFLKPKRKEKISFLRFLLEQVQWFTLPIVTLIFGAIPGLDAQTRLLFGKHMEYRLTEKH